MKLNLENQQFERLVAKKRLPGGKWFCHCECGNDVIVSTGSLRNGDTRSCGCLKNDLNRIDLTGQRFGLLRAIKPLNKVINKSMVWLFECDCKNLCEATVHAVKSEGRQSCGCLRYENKVKQASKMLEKRELINGTDVNIILSKKLLSNNTSGFKGVSWYNTQRLWAAKIQFQGKTYRLGFFHQLEDAVKARAEAEERLHGPFLEWYEEYKRQNNK